MLGFCLGIKANPLGIQSIPLGMKTTTTKGIETNHLCGYSISLLEEAIASEVFCNAAAYNLCQFQRLAHFHTFASPSHSLCLVRYSQYYYYYYYYHHHHRMRVPSPLSTASLTT